MKHIFAILFMLPMLAFASEPVKVGITHSVPFTIKDFDINGKPEWSGISIDLWEEIARDTGIEFQYVELSLKDNLDAVADGTVDIAIGAMSVTAERERIMDFTHPYYMSGLGIVSKTSQSTSFSVFGWGFAKAVGVLLVVLIVSGLAMRQIEHKKNPEFKKLGSGIWFSIVTMTTTGYGDKVPKTLIGRCYAAVLMVSSAIIFPALVASIATNIAIDQRNNQIHGVHDLSAHRIGVITGTSAIHYMKEHNLPFLEVGSAPELLNLIADGKLDGGVYDKPMLQYHAKSYPDLQILPATFEHQYYGFALKSDSSLREDINAEILRKSNNNVWLGTLNKYLGK